jgi:L-fuconate dehydratase
LKVDVIVWDAPQAIEWVKELKQVNPWFIEEPTAPDDALGHATIRKALKPYGIGVATGEHAHNRYYSSFPSPNILVKQNPFS